MCVCVCVCRQVPEDVHLSAPGGGAGADGAAAVGPGEAAGPQAAGGGGHQAGPRQGGPGERQEVSATWWWLGEDIFFLLL